jgi:hypothetical protein
MINIRHYHSLILIINSVHLSPQYVVSEQVAVINLKMFDSLKDFLQISQKFASTEGAIIAGYLKWITFSQGRPMTWQKQALW